MDKIEAYRQYIQQILAQYGSYKLSYGEVETELIFDKDRDHYQIVQVGWDGRQRVYGCSMHLDLKDGKIWIQKNSTEIDIAAELMALGVPKQDIVVGFHRPFLRQFTDFAASQNA